MKKAIFLLSIILIAFTTCKKDTEDEEKLKDPSIDFMEYKNSGKINAGGGQITLESTTSLGGTTILIPSGALNQEKTISMQVDNSVRPTGDTSSDLLKFEPNGLKFSKTVTLKIQVNKNITNPVLYCFTPDSMVMQQIPVLEFNQTEGYIRAEINHFSIYLVEDKVYSFFDAKLYNTGSSIKAKVEFGTDIGLAGIPVNKLNYISSLGTINSARKFIDYAIPVTNLGTIEVPEECYATLNVDLRQGNWLYSTSVKSVKLAVQRKGKQPWNSSWVIVSEVSPEKKVVFTSGIIVPDKREEFFSGKALVFDFKVSAETGKNYYLNLSWCLSSNAPGNWWPGRFTDVYDVNTYQDYPAWTTSKMINSDPDKNKNFVDDLYDNSAPTSPDSPSPSNSATGVKTATTLSWNCTDPDNDPLTYDVYLDTSSDPTTKVSSDQTAKAWSPVNLIAGTDYYWKIVAKDNRGGMTVGPVWKFTTNYSPLNPSKPNPSINATDIATSLTLSWECSDPDGDAVTYDVYFGTDNPPTTKVATGQTAKTLLRSNLNYFTPYFWKVTAKDNKGNSTPGAVWKFTTQPNPENVPVADFTASKTNISRGETIQFTDKSANSPNSWLWDFGDGNTSSAQNPSKIYTTAGTYTVSLKVTNSFGNNTKTVSNYITVNETVIPGETGSQPYNGYNYQTVKIGNQLWFSENLQTTKYNDGIDIPNLPDVLLWGADKSGAYCWYSNDISNMVTCGALYNWYAVNTNKLCPSGWRVPSKEDWNELKNFLTNNGFGFGGSGTDIAKSLAVKTNWRTALLPSFVGKQPESNNSSGFSGFPAGERAGGFFLRIGDDASWWSSTESTLFAYYAGLNYMEAELLINENNKADGMSVRCVKGDFTGIAPIADFNVSKTSITKGETIQFTDKSTNSPTNWLWDFGDGTTSTSQNPTHSYTTVGVYTVSLKVTNSLGNNTKTNTSYVTVAQPGTAPDADFIVSTTTPIVGQSVQFTDKSTDIPTSWLWNFGDGSTSTSQNPTHSYTTAGAYTVSLKVSNSFGNSTKTNTNYVTVTPSGTAPDVDFIVSMTTPTVGKSIQFTDKSTNTPTSWLWDFGDGTNSSQQNPSKTFNTIGNFTVSLKATNSFGSDTKTMNITVTEQTEIKHGELVYDGHTYKTVIIGGKEWMAENLCYLPLVYPSTSLSITESRYYVYDYNDSDVATAKKQSNYITYGVLYNWPAANSACPPGWHLPTESEWTELENYLIANGYNYDGTTTGNKIAKSMAATTNWNASTYNGDIGNNLSLNNKSGFSALPGGGLAGNFGFLGIYGQWWSSKETSAYHARVWMLRYNGEYSQWDGSYRKDLGFSVRCVRD